MEKYKILASTLVIGTLIRDSEGVITINFEDNLDCWSIPMHFYFPYSRQGQREFRGAIVDCWIANSAYTICKPQPDALLEYLGLADFDAWEIFKSFEGRVAGEQFWIKIDYDDIINSLPNKPI